MAMRFLKCGAIVCALIGWWHIREGGRRTQVLGDLETGFLLVPEV